MGKFTYVYILQSEIDPERYYSGCTDDVRDRLRRHNARK
ncbi:MAG: GIY-YIG nuclease family protein [Chthoniobacterales bacterium]